MQYRYSLEKGSKKHNCPKCNKRTYVRYVDNNSNEYLSYEFGRCDRENKCGYKQSPKGEFKNTYEVKYTPPRPTSFHPYRLVTESGQNFKENNFIQFLKTIITTKELEKVILKYLIGTSKYWNGATIFWQIDSNQKVRHGKIMLYNTETGKRVKNETGKSFINSVRNVLKLKKFNLKQCLFGLHLINERETKTIALVEGEKTAIIMSVFKPEYIWLATGSKQGFKYEMLKPIKNYNIISFPDKSEFNDWQSKAIELNEFGYKIIVSDLIEKNDFPPGTDLADVYLEQLKIKINKDPVKENTNQSPKLIETNAERIVKIFAENNPSILKLINTFDLTDENGVSINIKKVAQCI